MKVDGQKLNELNLIQERSVKDVFGFDPEQNEQLLEEWSSEISDLVARDKLSLVVGVSVIWYTTEKMRNYFPNPIDTQGLEFYVKLGSRGWEQIESLVQTEEGFEKTPIEYIYRYKDAIVVCNEASKIIY